MITNYKVIQRQILTFKSLTRSNISPRRYLLNLAKRVLITRMSVDNWGVGRLRLLLVQLFFCREFGKLGILNMGHLSHCGVYPGFTLCIGTDVTETHAQIFFSSFCILQKAVQHKNYFSNWFNRFWYTNKAFNKTNFSFY